MHPSTKDSTRVDEEGDEGRGRPVTKSRLIIVNSSLAGHKSPRQSSPRFFRATFPSSSVLQATSGSLATAILSAVRFRRSATMIDKFTDRSRDINLGGEKKKDRVEFG